MNSKAHSQKKRTNIIIGLFFFVFMIINVIPVRAEIKRQATASPTPTSLPTTCTNWNLTSDFRISPNNENPNRDSCNNLGIWKFMGSGGFSHTPANYYLLPIFASNFGGYPNLNTYLYKYTISSYWIECWRHDRGRCDHSPSQ